jgi:hypothetical protein
MATQSIDTKNTMAESKAPAISLKNPDENNNGQKMKIEAPGIDNLTIESLEKNISSAPPKQLSGSSLRPNAPLLSPLIPSTDKEQEREKKKDRVDTPMGITF